MTDGRLGKLQLRAERRDDVDAATRSFPLPWVWRVLGKVAVLARYMVPTYSPPPHSGSFKGKPSFCFVAKTPTILSFTTIVINTIIIIINVSR